jgi:hypothetical protein
MDPYNNNPYFDQDQNDEYYHRIERELERIESAESEIARLTVVFDYPKSEYDANRQLAETDC